MCESLPEEVRELADKNFALWKENPWHPSLSFKPLQEPKWSVRIGRDYRAVGIMHGDTIIWYWIGRHGAYDGVIRR